MADVLYYVSQQNGDDSYNGLSAATAWKTLTKATTTVPTPASGNNCFVYIGPGIYRERVIPLNSGFSADYKIIYRGDAYCQHLTSDTPGRIRITGCNTQEYPTNGRILDWTGKTNVELQDVEVDGSANDYCCYNVPVSRRVKIAGHQGFYGGVNYRCSAMCYGHCFNTAVNYTCKGISYLSTFLNGTNYNCIGASGSTGASFWQSTGQMHNHSCIAICSHNGFHGYSSYNYNCVAICCGAGFHFSTINYNCTAIACNEGFSSSASYSCQSLYCAYSPATLTSLISLNLDNLIPNILDTYGLKNYGYIHNTNISTTATMNLQTERLITLTPSEAGYSLGLQLNVSSLASSGEVLVELQKYIGSTWTTEKSKTVDVTTMAAGWIDFFWDTDADAGDNLLTAVASTWRYRITADVSAGSTVIYGSGATTPSYMALMAPSDENKRLDIKGLDRNGIVKGFGALSSPIVVLDDTLYHTAPPSIKIEGYGVHSLSLPMQAGVSTTVAYQVRHDGAASGKEPMIEVKGNPNAWYDVTITASSDTHSAGANVWEQLYITFETEYDGVLNINLINRDSAHNAWFSDPSVT